MGWQMNEFRSRHFGRQGSASSLVATKRPKGTKGDGGLAVPRQQPRTRDTRSADRQRLQDEVVTIRHKGKHREVELINLSGGGAMIADDSFAPALWDRVDLNLGEGGTVECVVRWIKEGRFGLEFAHETRIDCAEEERAAVLRAAIERSFPAAASEPRQAPAQSGSEPGSEHRGETRHPLIWSGDIHYDFGTTRVRLRNISAHGALIECSKHLPVGAEPLLDLGAAGTLFATVTWSRGDQVGLKFTHPFDLSQLARSKPEVTPPDWQKPDYLRGASDASPWGEHWGRLSLSELHEELDGFLKR